MTPSKIAGFILLAVGIVLFTMGTQASHSVADQISNTFTGRFTQTTTWYIVGGLAVGIGGLCLLLTGVRGKTS